MAFDVSTTHFRDFVRMVVTGHASIKTFVDLVRTVEQESVAWSHRRVLVDMRGVVGRLDETERMFLGELVAQHLPHLDKLACVVYRDQLTQGMAASDAGHGPQLRVFVANDEAQAWLLSSPAAGSSPYRAQPSHA